VGKEKKKAGRIDIDNIREIKELLKPGDLVMYDLSYDDMFDIHQREAKSKEVGMVISVLTRTVQVKWQRSGVCDTYNRSELTVLSRIQK
tara:strand:+ start:216 stop:482 length:267 start_codon:yes stop_codon:yes gene_type:complete